MLVLVVREMGTRTVGRNLCSIRTGLLETLSKVSICEGRQNFFSWVGRSGKKLKRQPVCTGGGEVDGEKEAK